MDIPWILVSVALGVVVLAVLALMFYKKRGWERKVDYKSYYIMGITWIPLGIIFSIIFESLVGMWFLLMGVIYMSIGLKNKKKWGKPQKIPPTYNKLLMIAVLLGVIFLILGIVVFEFMR